MKDLDRLKEATELLPDNLEGADAKRSVEYLISKADDKNVEKVIYLIKGIFHRFKILIE